jgi:hypothetical protein
VKSTHTLRFVGLVWLALSGASTGAQGFRINGISLANFVELRPVAEDSMPDSLATGSGLIRESAIGLVSCPQGQTQCYFYRSLARTHTVPLTQDVEVTGWGFGEGVSVYAHVRGHAHGGGVEELWTREGDEFNALAAYVEVDRDRWTARAGRQWLTSQLGVNNFDGLSLELHSTRRLVVQGYVGSSLIQGLSEPPTSSALAAADVLPPDVRGIVVGATARWRPAPAFALSAEYQREIRSDRAGFFSERMAIDGVLLWRGTSLVADAQVDFASRAVNELRVGATRPLLNVLVGGVQAVHSTPFFPLWTIWGVFSPVGYNEVSANAGWHSVRGVGFVPLRDDGWTTIASGSWQMSPAWELTGSYRRDIGFGASKSDGNGGIRWQREGGAWLGVTASALQNIYEFRVANGYLAGASLAGALPLTPAVGLAAQIGLYRQLASNTALSTVNWSQRRAFVRLDWTVGRDPGAAALPAITGARQP